MLGVLVGNTVAAELEFDDIAGSAVLIARHDPGRGIMALGNPLDRPGG